MNHRIIILTNGWWAQKIVNLFVENTISRMPFGICDFNRDVHISWEGRLFSIWNWVQFPGMLYSQQFDVYFSDFTGWSYRKTSERSISCFRTNFWTRPSGLAFPLMTFSRWVCGWHINHTHKQCDWYWTLNSSIHWLCFPRKKISLNDFRVFFLLCIGFDNGDGGLTGADLAPRQTQAVHYDRALSGNGFRPHPGPWCRQEADAGDAGKWDASYSFQFSAHCSNWNRASSVWKV